MTQPITQGVKKKGRVLRRKTDHSIIERRRREKINEKLVQLQSIVPACKLECQDLFQRRFDQPTAEMAKRTSRAKNAKGNDAKVEKAKVDLLEKIRTTMVLEKLCIISHTVDYVLELQGQVTQLRAICECDAERINRYVSSTTAERLLDENMMARYRELLKQAQSRDRSNSSSFSTAAPLTPPLDSSLPSTAFKRNSDEMTKPDPAIPVRAHCHHVQKKRRLHWGSDTLRSAAVKTSKLSKESTAAPPTFDAASDEEDCKLFQHADKDDKHDNSASESDQDLSLCTSANCPSKVCSEPKCLEQPREICNHPDSCCRHECPSQDEVTAPPQRPSLPNPSQLFPHLNRAHWHHHHRHLPPLTSLYPAKSQSLRPLSLYTATSTFPSQRYSARSFAL